MAQRSGNLHLRWSEPDESVDCPVHWAMRQFRRQNSIARAMGGGGATGGHPCSRDGGSAGGQPGHG